MDVRHAAAVAAAREYHKAGQNQSPPAGAISGTAYSFLLTVGQDQAPVKADLP